MSPEQTRGDEIDGRSDLFSLGVVFYELLTGKLPFRGDHETAIVYSILHNEPEPLAAHRDDLPDGLQEVVSRALEKDRDQRYSTAADLLSGLGQVNEEQPVAVNAGKGRRTFLKFAVPGVAIFLAVFLFLVFKPFTFEVSPDQEVAASENTLAIMYFENIADRGDPQRLGEIVADLLITGLSESEYVRVVSSQRLYDILRLQGKEGEKVLDETTATAVATHAGAKWILTGRILQVEPSVVVSAQLADVESGDIVASQRIDGRPGETIFAVVDRLAAEAKQDLSLPEEAREEPGTQVADITTHSIDAYRHYIEGMENLEKFYWEEARESFEKALAYDSTFAMAYLRLLAPSIPGTEAEKMPWREKAVLYADKASRKERMYIMCESAEFAGNDEKAIAGYESIIDV